MEITFDTIISLLGLFIGGGGGAFFTWRYMRRKAKAEAQTEEVNMAKAVQDAYQQMLADKETDLEDRKKVIQELREERDHYKNDRNELREQMEKLSRSVAEWKSNADEERDNLKRTVARLGRKVDAMAPFMCGDLSCKLRQRVTISDDGEVKTKRVSRQHKDIDPIDQQDL